jgi:hypothetical protein
MERMIEKFCGPNLLEPYAIANLPLLLNGPGFNMWHLRKLKDIYQCHRFSKRKEVELLSDYILLQKMMLLVPF